MKFYHFLFHTTWELPAFYCLNFKSRVQLMISFFYFFLHIHIPFSPEQSLTILLMKFWYLPVLVSTATIPKLEPFSPIFPFPCSQTQRCFSQPYKPNVKIVIQPQIEGFKFIGAKNQKNLQLRWSTRLKKLRRCIKNSFFKHSKLVSFPLIHSVYRSCHPKWT